MLFFVTENKFFYITNKRNRIVFNAIILIASIVLSFIIIHNTVNKIFATLLIIIIIGLVLIPIYKEYINRNIVIEKNNTLIKINNNSYNIDTDNYLLIKIIYGDTGSVSASLFFCSPKYKVNKLIIYKENVDTVNRITKELSNFLSIKIKTNDSVLNF